MIFTECVYCDEPFAVPLDINYMAHLNLGRQLVTKHTCDGCGKTNYVEHRQMGGETFGEDDERAKQLYQEP